MKYVITFAAIALMSSLPALAQGGPVGPPPFGRMGPGGPHEFGGPRGGKVVTGAPYSATVTNTVVQQLANGGNIQRATTGQIARDKDGRTYEQETITGGPLATNGGSTTITFISDPVAGYSYMLNSAKKTAVRRPMRTGGNGNMDPAAAPARPRHADTDEVVQADLDPDSGSGVTATGKSFTRTIPAGKIGNSQPIVSSSSTWYSSELQVVVKAIRNDPRFGQSNYALTNIVTKDPDQTLFQVPSGYTVSDAPQHGPDHGADHGARRGDRSQPLQ